MFAEKGFHPTTIKDIAREAGIADGTIYIYFENKTALLLGILDRMRVIAQRDENFSQETPGDMHSFMKAFVLHPLMAFKADNFELFKVMVSAILVNQELRELYLQKILAPMLAQAETSFQRWADQGMISSLNMPLAVRAISGMILGLLLELSIGDKTLEAQWDALPDLLATLILDGMGVEQS